MLRDHPMIESMERYGYPSKDYLDYERRLEENEDDSEDLAEDVSR